VLLTGCLLVTGSNGTRPPIKPQPQSTTITRFGALRADRYDPPDGTRPVGVIVTVHGCCGDRRDMADLARALARRGATVLNTDMRAVGHGGGWPASYLDVVCAVAAGDRLARRLGGVPLTLLGWDDGALVGAVVALGWPAVAARAGDCTVSPGPHGPARVVGLSGHYGWTGEPTGDQVNPGTIQWFGGRPEERPDAWSLGNPGWWLAHSGRSRDERPSVLLLGTAADETSREWAAALRARAFDATYLACGPGSHDELVHTRDDVGAVALDALAARLGLPGRAGRPGPPPVPPDDLACRAEGAPFSPAAPRPSSLLDRAGRGLVGPRRYGALRRRAPVARRARPGRVRPPSARPART
jgi:hypothetical protein